MLDHVFVNLLHGLTGVFGHNLFKQFLNSLDFDEVDLLVGNFAARAARRLVNHNDRVWQGETLAFGTTA